MKTKLLFTFCISLLVFAQSALGQSPSQASDADTETIRQTVKKQQAEIDLLREELKKESELRKEQTAMLESILNQIAKLTAGSPNGSPAAKSEIIPAVLKEPAVSTTQTANAVQPASKQQKATESVEAGFGKIKFNGLLQAGLLAGDENLNQTFRIRRVELKFSGEIMPKVRWSTMFDLAKALTLNTATSTIDGFPVLRTVGVNQAARVFQEAFITLSHFKRANINVGQFKVPLSQEGLQSTATLDTIERALFMNDRSRGGGLGDARDIGVMAFGPLNKQLDYQIGVFNGIGESQSDIDANDEKAFVGRMVFKPSLIKGLQIGGSGAYTVGQRITATRRDRLGGEAVYDRNKFRIKSEFMIGVDGEVHRRGYYAHFGYRILPKLEVIARYDTFDPDTRRDNSILTVNERDYIGGINYYIKNNNFKLQLNYIRKTFTTDVTPSRNLFLANLQTSW